MISVFLTYFTGKSNSLFKFTDTFWSQGCLDVTTIFVIGLCDEF